jgi:hypothetical protein
MTSKKVCRTESAIRRRGAMASHKLSGSETDGLERIDQRKSNEQASTNDPRRAGGLVAYWRDLSRPAESRSRDYVVERRREYHVLFLRIVATWDVKFAFPS